MVLAVYGLIRYAIYRKAPQPSKHQPSQKPATRIRGTSHIVLLNNRYEIVRRITRGGMATIELARDHQTNTYCVIKVPRSDTEHSATINLDKLYIEADYLRQFNHPNILRFVDLFTTDNTPYLMVEYLAGKDLQELCERKPAAEDVVLSWGGQILNAIDYIHQRGIIHRDLNPSNIMIRTDNSIAIIDFGTAKSISLSMQGHDATGQGTMIFKSGFEIPEQVREGHADQRSDLYAVGGTIFFFLTGRGPPNWMHPRNIASDLMEHRVSERTARCIAQVMSIEPDSRFKDARALRRALGV